MNAKQDNLPFPSDDSGDNKWSVISPANAVRRLKGYAYIRVRRYLNLLDPNSSCDDLQIGFDKNLSGLTKYYTKQEVDSRFGTASRIQVFKYPQESSDTRFYILGRLNLPNGGNQATITINAWTWNKFSRSEKFQLIHT